MVNQNEDSPRDGCRCNDEVPWQSFVGGLRGFIFGASQTDAEDVLQETLLVRLHEAAGSLRDADRVETWVFSIARRAIVDYYRQGERRPIDGTVGRADEVRSEAPPWTDYLAEYNERTTCTRRGLCGCVSGPKNSLKCVNDPSS